MKRSFISLVSALTLTAMSVGAVAQTAVASPLSPWSWLKSSGNPVVPAACGVTDPTKPSVLYESAGNYKMYFTTHPGNNGAQIFLATTADGGLNWICGTGNTPVLPTGASGSFDEIRAVGPSVIKDGGTYKMWYSGRNATAQWSIGYATSPDGVAWTKVSSITFNPTPVTTWDSQMVRNPSVVKVGATYHMWYEGTAKWPYFQIGHATSTDGTTWAKDASPVLSPTTGAWDSNEVYAPQVVYDGASYHMFYSGSTGDKWLLGHATSPDGVIWTKDSPANAIISPSSAGWDNGDSTDYASAVLDGATWKLFYSGAGATGYRIGLATLTNQAQLQFRPLTQKVQVGQTLDINLDLNDVASLYGYQFIVNYDATKVTAVGSFDNALFNTTGGAVPTGWDASCAAGTCKFAVSQQRPSGLGPFNGRGPLGKITLTGTAPGLVGLRFSNDILSDRNGMAITHSSTEAWIQVYGTATLNGIVSLQGRAAPLTAGTVTLYEQYGIFAPTSVPFDATTGAWTATVPAYASGTAYDIVASHSLYLSNQELAVAVTPSATFVQTPTMLLGGDANNSGKVEIGDITCIGSDFNGTPHTCGATGSSDINADGTTNIQDLSIAGGNYDLATPQPW